jgi:lambda repressor-like predicted transcriptional regulator
LNLAEHITNVIEQQGRTKVWVAEKAEINYKTFVDKLTRNTLKGEDLLKIAKILNIDLNELKNKV